MKKINKITGVFLAALLTATAVLVPTNAASNPVKTTEASVSTVSQNIKIDSDSLKKSGNSDSNAFSSAANKELKTAGSKTISESNNQNEVEFVEGEAFVVLKDNKKASTLQSNFEVKKTYSFDINSHTSNYALVSDDSMSTEEIVDKLKENPDVKYAFPNFVYKPTGVTNDTYSDFQWQLSNTGQNGGTAGLDTAPQKLWKMADQSSAECVVAVLDTGINYNHPDLTGALWKNTYSQLSGYGSCGYDFTGESYNGSPYDFDGHGTNVAGLIAETGDNGIGTSGMNKKGVKIMALKVLGEDGGTYDMIFNALDYVLTAKELGVNIKAINMSLGGFGNPVAKQVYDEAFDILGEAGIITVIAAGNDALNIDYSYDLSSEYGPDYSQMYVLPAATTSKYAVTVAAVNEKNELASFSNYGTKNVDIAAPGVSMLAAYSDNVFTPALYDSSKINRLCNVYENFDSSQNMILTNIHTETTTVSGFGNNSRGLKVTVNNANEHYGLAALRFTTQNSYSEYYLSMDLGFLSEANDTDRIYIGNIPYSYLNIYSISDIINNGYLAYLNPSVSNYWEHMYLPLSDFSVNSSSSDRVFVIVIDSSKNTYSLSLDNVAITKQGVATSEFGQYEFLQGTSQATPTVTGAAALIANCNPSLTPTQIINLIKTYGKTENKLSKYVANSKVLNLDKVADTIKLLENVLYGDVNSDGKVDAKDRIQLSRYLAKWKTVPSVNKAASDLNLDGELDAKDRIILTRYLAKWSGYDKLPKK